MSRVRTGDVITIYRVPIARRPFIEGNARIVEPVRGLPDLYRVQFEGEDVSRLRLVHSGAWQSTPDAVAAALLSHWRVTLMPELLVELPSDFTQLRGGPSPLPQSAASRQR